jgi:uncharacterized membrane protein YfcA
MDIFVNNFFSFLNKQLKIHIIRIIFFYFFFTFISYQNIFSKKKKKKKISPRHINKDTLNACHYRTNIEKLDSEWDFLCRHAA